MKRQETIDKIIAAARQPCPDIVELFELQGTDGKWYRGAGFPLGVKSTGERKSVGFAYRDKHGTTFGVRGATKAELETRHAAGQDKVAADFRCKLEIMDDPELQLQADYWVK